MKQLIHSTDQHVIAALDEEAVVALSTSGDGDEARIVVGLNPSKESGGGDVSGGNPALAVASSLSKDGKSLTCAVSRQDKTLALYSVPLAGCDDSSNNVDPIAVYKTPKRVGSLDFASVPPGIAGGNPVETIISADFEGNAIAYPVEASASNNVSRLLLGHTASMLTGLRIVHNSTDNTARILTSDRDEKVRVSSFPNTFVVEGYLLGHTEYVSSLDVSKNDACPFCVTCGGDGTIRLWDYTTCEELDAVKTDQTSSDGGEEGGGSVEVPLGVTMNPDGSIAAVIWNDTPRVDIYRVTEQKALEKIQSFECSEQPLIATFLADGALVVLAKDPAFIVQYKAVLEEGSSRAVSFSLISDDSSPLTKCLKDVGTQKQVTMPESTLEAADLRKEEVSSRQSVRDKEWNNAERKVKDRARIARRKKRKRQEKKAAKQAMEG
mmetsp:Transcript_2727/g.8006  ORF Transcript_2727/g.8006 Transcript_2727/m.8006 type:complete len:437 (+) Transcript_2727:144-1454(+)